MDTSDPDIHFNVDGTCNHCTHALKILNSPPHTWNKEEKRRQLEELMEKVRASTKGRKYNCIIGVSGGVDSTYVAYLVKEQGLNPLAVHLDNGWNSEIATRNIENICKKLEIDLVTYVIDWEEFRDLQLSFLKASTPDSEIPSDHAIYALMYQQAKKENLKYILAGYNYASESILPSAWSRGHFDWKYIEAIQKQFGHMKLKTFPHFSYYELRAYKKSMNMISTLDYVDYDKAEAKKIIKEKLGWQDYGAKHHESLYTKFFQTYILPTKFGYDKRRAHLSSLIVTGQLTRQGALLELEKCPYNQEQIEEDVKYVINKFDITLDEFNSIMNLPKKNMFDYPNYKASWIIKCITKVRNIHMKKHKPGD
jgi:N-acetyl sugar amidotransferase